MKIREVADLNLEIELEAEEREKLSFGKLLVDQYAKNLLHIVAEKPDKDTRLGLEDQRAKQQGYVQIYTTGSNTHKIFIYIPQIILENECVYASFFSSRLGNIDISCESSLESQEDVFVRVIYKKYNDSLDSFHKLG